MHPLVMNICQYQVQHIKTAAARFGWGQQLGWLLTVAFCHSPNIHSTKETEPERLKDGAKTGTEKIGSATHQPHQAPGS